MRKRKWTIISLMLVLLGCLWGGLWVADRLYSWVYDALAPQFSFQASTRKFDKIQAGMTLAQVEEILGEGDRRQYPPGLRENDGNLRSAVEGDEFWVWNDPYGAAIWVGIRDGVVCDKYLWIPSF